MPNVLIVGASRGLGHAIATEYVRRGWHVVGTVRGSARTELHELADAHPDHVGIEELDVTHPEQLEAIRDRLSGNAFDALFINAGTTLDEDALIGAVPTDDFVTVMVTNALSPMRVIEALQDVVAPAGLVGAMSSGLGSIANNETGGRELYRASKAALNMFMRSYAARQPHRPVLVLAPGWIRTALGGDDAPYTLEETVPDIVDVLIAKGGRPGVEYLDRFGQPVPW